MSTTFEHGEHLCEQTVRRKPVAVEPVTDDRQCDAIVLIRRLARARKPQSAKR